MNLWHSEYGDYDVNIGEFGASLVVEHDDSKKIADLPADIAFAFDQHIKGEAVSLRLDLHGLSPLRQMTLAKLLEIPHGEVRSYSWVAREIGRPSAVRAVATAIAKNPLPMLIPCHRVVRSDGMIGEYSLGGPKVKRRILESEGLDIARVEDFAKRAVRFVGDAGKKMFHLTTCRLVPTDVANYVELKTAAAAEAALLQPCARCRPVFMY